MSVSFFLINLLPMYLLLLERSNPKHVYALKKWIVSIGRAIAMTLAVCLVSFRVLALCMHSWHGLPSTQTLNLLFSMVFLIPAIVLSFSLASLSSKIETQNLLYLFVFCTKTLLVKLDILVLLPMVIIHFLFWLCLRMCWTTEWRDLTSLKGPNHCLHILQGSSSLQATSQLCNACVSNSWKNRVDPVSLSSVYEASDKNR